MNKNITLLLFFILSLTANTLSVLSENSELKISSNELKIDSKGRNSIFIGNVYVEDNNLKVWSNKMTINFDENNDQIKEIIANGAVRIIRIKEGSEILGDTAKYILNKKTVIVIGNVNVKEKGNTVTGNKLVLDLEKSTSIMVGSEANRVETIIIQE